VGEPLLPLGATTLRADKPGYVVPITLTVPNLPAGSPALVAVRVLYDENLVVPTVGDSGPWIIHLGDSSSPLPSIPVVSGPIRVVFICPEPETMMLIALGLATLWWRRANEVTSPNAGIALPFQCEHHRPGVGEFGR
jgi:hypothetical protein